MTSAGASSAHSGECLADDRHNADDHHERHSAEQHKFKVTQPTRGIVAEMMRVQLIEWVDPHKGCPQPQVVDFFRAFPTGAFLLLAIPLPCGASCPRAFFPFLTVRPGLA